MDKIVYLPHPVSVEEKRSYNADGFRVVDDRFKPAGFQADEKPEPVIKRKGKRNASA